MGATHLRKILICLTFTLSLVHSIGPAQSSVGLIVQNQTTTVVGGSLLGGGVSLFGLGVAVGNCVFGCDDIGELDFALTAMIYGIYAAGLGIVVLDESNKLYPVEFTQLGVDDLDVLPGISFEEMISYNDEVGLLNRINHEQSLIRSKSDVTGVWDVFENHLSPDTIKVVNLILAQE
jgi:hypothetical protein